MVILPRGTYERVPLDPRFTEWGQDDESWSAGLRTLAGNPWRGTAALWHLFHPPARRLNQHVGNAANWALHIRYRFASGDRQAMRALLDEFATTSPQAHSWPCDPAFLEERCPTAGQATGPP